MTRLSSKNICSLKKKLIDQKIEKTVKERLRPKNHTVSVCYLLDKSLNRVSIGDVLRYYYSAQWFEALFKMSIGKLTPTAEMAMATMANTSHCASYSLCAAA